MTKTDLRLKQDIEEELRWDPEINAAQIGVSVDKGVVSLLGSVDTFAQKWAAEDATKRVGGVRSVAEDLTVKILGHHTHNDTELAAAIKHVLEWNSAIPATVTAFVARGIVTVEGQVSWNFQREAAQEAVRHIKGVVGVNNRIMIKPDVSPEQVKEKITAALLRQATTDASSINVETSHGKVTLTGHAASWQSITDASNAAWAAPGVTDVVDHLTVSF